MFFFFKTYQGNFNDNQRINNKFYFFIITLLTRYRFMFNFKGIMKNMGSNLTIDEKAVLIQSNGLEISHCIYSDISVTLYRIKEDFIEIWQDVKAIKVLKIVPIKDNSINPFLKYLDIASLN
jgi:hypothetical protein